MAGLGYTELGAGDPVRMKREYRAADYKDVWGQVQWAYNPATVQADRQQRGE